MGLGAEKQARQGRENNPEGEAVTRVKVTEEWSATDEKGMRGR
jgi:hypothetical protein